MFPNPLSNMTSTCSYKVHTTKLCTRTVCILFVKTNFRRYNCGKCEMFSETGWDWTSTNCEWSEGIENGGKPHINRHRSSCHKFSDRNHSHLLRSSCFFFSLAWMFQKTAVSAEPRNFVALVILIFVMYDIYMGVSKNNGTPKWMVYNGKPH